jgi:type I restriction enzyme S subunit
MEALKLGELCELVTKGTTPTTLGMKLNQGSVNFIKVECLSEDGQIIRDKIQKIDEDTHNKLKRSQLQDGDILFSIAGSIGRMAIVTSDFLPGNTNQAVAILRPKIDLVDTDFLYYSLRDVKSQGDARRRIVQSVQNNLSLGELSDLTISLPPRATQVAISSFMKVLDEKIALNKSISRKLEQIAQTLFKSWFVEFDPVKAKMAGEKPVGMDDATAALFPDSLVDSEIGPIPKGWVVKSFFDFQLEIESGARPKGGVKGIAHGVPSIGAESINGLGVFDFSKTKYVSEEFFEKMKKGKPEDFDVLLYKDGGKPGEFKPRVGMFGRGFPFMRYAINEHVFLLRSAELGPAFTYFWIRMERTLDILRNRGIKAAIPGINQQDVGTLPVLWSHPVLIARFTELCMPYLELILTVASESLELSRLRDSLLPRLISGELQIPEEMLVS